MPSVKSSNFKGMTPRSNRSIGRPNEAIFAVNTDLAHNVLRGYRNPLVVAPDGAPNKTIYLTDAGWIRFQELTDVAGGLPGCPRVVAAGGSTPYPMWAYAQDAVAGNWLRLGLPIPGVPVVTVPPGSATYDRTQSGGSQHVVSVSDTTTTVPGGSWSNSGGTTNTGGSYSGSTVTLHGGSFTLSTGPSPVEYRRYLIRYVDSFGNIGPASSASESFAVDDGKPVTLTLPATPLGWDIAEIEIYRASSGFDESSKEFKTGEFLLVDIVAPGTISYVDSLTNLDIPADPLYGEEYLPPPANAEHMAAEPNGTQLAMAVGRNVYISEPHDIHAFPAKYTLTLDDDIVGLCWGYDGLYVMTDGHPYYVSNEVNDAGARAVVRMSETLPCVSKASICITPEGGCGYASDTGISYLRGKSAKVLSLRFWFEDDWAALNPSTMKATIHRGVFYGWSDCPDQFSVPGAHGWRFDFNDAIHEDGEPSLVLLTKSPTALHRSREDKFYVALPEGICEWNAASTVMPWWYRTKLMVAPGHLNMAAAKVVFERYGHEYTVSQYKVNYQIRTGDRVLYKRDIDHSQPFRLPHNWRHLNFEFELQKLDEEPYVDIVEIREVHSATSIIELSERGNPQ